MRTEREDNAINRVLRARGLPGLDEPGITEALAFLVDDHQHFCELLRACDPVLRRDMYDAMSPHLRFPAKPLDHYLSMAKAHAEAAELPTIDAQGNLQPYNVPSITTIEVAEFEMVVECSRCAKGAIFLGAHKGDAIFTMRAAGWAYDDGLKHICPECLDQSTN